jgi:hypothetical protein
MTHLRYIKVYSNSRNLVFVQKDKNYGPSNVVYRSGYLQPHTPV